MSDFQIQIDKYEGPFNGLLGLIEKRKLHINEISLAQVADDYIAYVSEREFRLSDAASFIVVAATLMVIKSRSLLPSFILSSEEEHEVKDLQDRLTLFSIFSAQVPVLHSSYKKTPLFPKLFKPKKQEIIFTPDERITLEHMRYLVDQVCKEAPQEVFTPKRKVERQLTLKEVIDSILNRVRRFIRARFSEIMISGDKKSAAVSFLAVLELFKQGDITLVQQELFGEIMIEHAGVHPPFYSKDQNDSTRQ